MRICIIGGGMAGIICAISAAVNKDNEITIYERQSSIGKKIAITGNGKCNLSNINVSDSSHFSSLDNDILKDMVDDFDNKRCQEFYESMGIYTTYVRGGMYPLCGNAGSMVSMFCNRLNELGVRIVTDTYINSVDKADKGYIVNEEKYDAVVLAFGGKAGIYGENGCCGIEIIKELELQGVRPSPALTGIICKENMKSISGVRTHAKISLLDRQQFIYCDEGELQLAENGLSGIPVFNVTNHFPYNLSSDNEIKLSVDFAPLYDEAKLSDILKNIRKQTPNRSMELSLLGLMNCKLARYILEKSGIPSNGSISAIDDSDLKRLIINIKNQIFSFDSLRNYKNAQVMRGGVRLTEIDSNFELKKYPNIFLIGEMLDVSGECGGYNLYFAYHSGRKVGEHLA